MTYLENADYPILATAQPGTVVLIRAASVYGNLTLYPVNTLARRLADLAGTVTLTIAALRIIRRLGFEVVVDAEESVAAMLRDQLN